VFYGATNFCFSNENSHFSCKRIIIIYQISFLKSLQPKWKSKFDRNDFRVIQLNVGSKDNRSMLHNNGLRKNRHYSKLNILVIYIHLSTFIVCKSDQSIIKTKCLVSHPVYTILNLDLVTIWILLCQIFEEVSKLDNF